MKPTIRIDVVSDVMCPWCIVGFKRLERAMVQYADRVDFDVHWQPFELNPQMADEGENLRDHLIRKYRISKEDSVRTRETLTELGKRVGFDFQFTDDKRIYNTFKAHQLLHWAGQTNQSQTDLKQALFTAYFTDGKDISQTEVLLEVVASLGWDRLEAEKILSDGRYQEAVKETEEGWLRAGVQGVPAVVFDQRLLVSGAQETDTFAQVVEQVLTEIKSPDSVPQA